MQPIRLGSAGPEVTDVQERLANLGFPTDGDDPGVFGPQTQEAVRQFQQDRGLLADGVVGEDTWKVLVEAGYQLGDRNLWHRQPMLRGDDVRELQRRLNRLGFDAGRVDGILGPDTEQALREFQLNVGLGADGIAGPDTIQALRRLHRQHQSATAHAVKEKEALLRRPERTSLAGSRILLDPGHGPDDPGIAADGGVEHEICWQIVNRCAGRLTALGVHVVLSRGPSTTPGVSDRARLANDEDVDAVLTVHLNGLPSPKARGAAAYYFAAEGVVSEAGRRYAQLLVDHVVDRTGTLNCRTHPSSQALLRETRAPAVIVEPGFLTHPEEGPLLRRRDHQDRIAEGLVRATVDFLTGRVPRAALPVGPGSNVPHTAQTR